jgi:hypothetical protein
MEALGTVDYRRPGIRADPRARPDSEVNLQLLDQFGDDTKVYVLIVGPEGIPPAH